jgi:cholesterol oxidase
MGRYDVVVIGSGFGGAVTACRAAEAGRSVLLLERGRRYRPGDFARNPLEMSTNLWDPSENLFGLFQIMAFRNLDAIVSSGLGGGSLIYANVMLPMPPEWFETTRACWPIEYDDLLEHYGTVADVMGANEFPVDRMPERSTRKAIVFRTAVERRHLEYRPAPLAVTFAGPGQMPGTEFGDPGDNAHGEPVQRRTCRLCGECNLGCNDGAKNTLDFTYLARASRAGATILPLHEARQISETEDGYRVGYVEHEPPDDWRSRRPEGSSDITGALDATVVVLAGGALGSTRLLLSNRAGLPRLSPALGRRFSGNGDVLGFVTGGKGMVVDSPRSPVITGVARAGGAPDGGPPPALLIEDGGYPEFLSWLGEALSPGFYRRAGVVIGTRWWKKKRGQVDTNFSANVARMLGSARVSRSTLPLLGMGLDAPTGRIRLSGGKLDVQYSAADSERYFEQVLSTMRSIATGTDSRFLESPSARLSRSVTVHPLGGCPMGSDPHSGVVDSHGEVFGHRGLFVADGAVLPGPVGANPSMTIAALAERFSRTILERCQ